MFKAKMIKCLKQKILWSYTICKSKMYGHYITDWEGEMET